MVESGLSRRLIKALSFMLNCHLCTQLKNRDELQTLAHFKY